MVNVDCINSVLKMSLFISSISHICVLWVAKFADETRFVFYGVNKCRFRQINAGPMTDPNNEMLS